MAFLNFNFMYLVSLMIDFYCHRVGELDKDQSLHNGASFYKLEMINIQIVSSYGNQACFLSMT